MHFGMLTMLSVLLILAPCVQPGTEILWAVTLEDPSTDDDRTTLLTIDDLDQAGGVTTAACQNSIRVPGFSEILCPRLNFAKVIARGPPVAPSDTSSQNLCVQYHSQSDFYSNGRSPVHDLIAFATVHSINLCGKQDPGRFYGAQDLKRTEHTSSSCDRLSDPDPRQRCFGAVCTGGEPGFAGQHRHHPGPGVRPADRRLGWVGGRVTGE